LVGLEGDGLAGMDYVFVFILVGHADRPFKDIIELFQRVVS
jgi:hypothetical protein